MNDNKPIRSFRDLIVYQRSYKAMLRVASLILSTLPSHEKFDLKDQLSRSSKAIPRLIAEGYSKRHQRLGFKKYLDDAVAESNETIVSIEQSRDLYLKQVPGKIKVCDELVKEYDIISRQLYTLGERWQSFR
jgi:four helix bundle protein